jgi:DNA-binding Lrp family transcriptional regulator
MQKSDQLDELDYSLVNALQIAPRAPWSLIGEVLGISPVTAARRWERLTGEGHAWMTGYCSSTLMRHMPYVLVTLGCVAGSVEQVADALLDDSHTVTILHTAGTSDLLLGVWISDLRMLSRYVLDRLNRTPGVTTVRVSVATEMFTEASRWRLRSLDPLQQRALSDWRRDPQVSSPTISPGDRQLIVALSGHGRATLEDLADRTQLSVSTVRRRLHRHLGSGALAFRCEVPHTTAGFPVEATLWISVPPAWLARTAAELSRLPQTRMCAAVIGSSNLVATVWLRSMSDLSSLETEIMARVPDIRVNDRLLTLRHLKLMGQVLDGSGRAERYVPMDIWREPAC